MSRLCVSRVLTIKIVTLAEFGVRECGEVLEPGDVIFGRTSLMVSWKPGVSGDTDTVPIVAFVELRQHVSARAAEKRRSYGVRSTFLSEGVVAILLGDAEGICVPPVSEIELFKECIASAFRNVDVSYWAKVWKRSRKRGVGVGGRRRGRRVTHFAKRDCRQQHISAQHTQGFFRALLFARSVLLSTSRGEQAEQGGESDEAVEENCFASNGFAVVHLGGRWGWTWRSCWQKAR
jgi:hypothetical protein